MAPARATPRPSLRMSFVWRPYAPPFMRSAPPIAPGMPRKNASPAMPASCAAFATRKSGAAVPARTRLPSTLMSLKPRPSRITTPGTPPSRTMRLEPRPMTVTGISRGRLASRYARSLSSSGMNSACAGPPTRNQVSGASGSLASSRPRRSGSADFSWGRMSGKVIRECALATAWDDGCRVCKRRRQSRARTQDRKAHTRNAVTALGVLDRRHAGIEVDSAGVAGASRPPRAKILRRSMGFVPRAQLPQRRYQPQLPGGGQPASSSVLGSQTLPHDLPRDWRAWIALMFRHSALNLGPLLVRQLEVGAGLRNAFDEVVSELKPFLGRQFHSLIAKRFIHAYRIVAAPLPGNITPSPGSAKTRCVAPPRGSNVGLAKAKRVARC